ncbi:hypothetical protein CsSME_00009354 [Camellia sinensis var. sinensis]
MKILYCITNWLKKKSIRSPKKFVEESILGQIQRMKNQLVKEEVHDLTQQVCAIKDDNLIESGQTNLQNSMIKKIKTKARKTTEISDNEYGGKKVKVEKEKEHKDETISNKYAVAQLLPFEDKYKLQILWKEK